MGCPSVTWRNETGKLSHETKPPKSPERGKRHRPYVIESRTDTPHQVAARPNRAGHHAAASPSSRGRPPSSETKPAGSSEKPCSKSAGAKQLADFASEAPSRPHAAKRRGAKRLADFASEAPGRPHAAEPCAGKRPAAPYSAISMCGWGAAARSPMVTPSTYFSMTSSSPAQKRTVVHTSAR